MPLHIGETQIFEWISNSGLAGALVRLMKMFDAIWIVLAAASAYLYAAEREGLAVARQWAVRVMGGSMLLAWIGAATDFPFGHFIYTDNMGARIGQGPPFTVPLLWLTLIVCSRYLVLSLFPALRHWQLALGTAFVVLLTDINLEQIAWQVRFYWIWYPHQYSCPHWPPVQNFVAWFVAAFVFALAMQSNPRHASNVKKQLEFTPSSQETQREKFAETMHLRPVIILILINAVFLSVHCFR